MGKDTGTVPPTEGRTGGKVGTTPEWAETEPHEVRVVES